jgi:signal peptidase I
MRPGLIVGDFILISKFSYGIRLPFVNQAIVPLGKPARGDVVVFRFPLDPKTNYIKRVVGIPGDKVEYRNKTLSVNGVKYASQPLGEYRYADTPGKQVAAVRMLETLPSGKYETLNVAGEPTLNPFAVLAFPQHEQCQHDETGFTCSVPEGQYLMLGDNRDNSNDGRYWGFVPDHLLAGKAFLVWMNIGNLGRIGTRIE